MRKRTATTDSALKDMTRQRNDLLAERSSLKLEIMDLKTGVAHLKRENLRLYDIACRWRKHWNTHYAKLVTMQTLWKENMGVVPGLNEDLDEGPRPQGQNGRSEK